MTELANQPDPEFTNAQRSRARQLMAAYLVMSLDAGAAMFAGTIRHPEDLSPDTKEDIRPPKPPRPNARVKGRLALGLGF